jgi:hypothetical protein
MTRQRMHVALAVVALLLGVDFAAPAAAQRMDRNHRTAEPPPPTKYRVSDDDLQRIGIAHGDMPAFPNKCYGDVSISNEFLDRFRSRGFTLEALCLALTSPWVRYNVETGKPLALTKDYLLEIPDCFKKGTPFLDCTFAFSQWDGQKLTGRDQREYRALANAVDAAVRRVLARGRYKTECRCEDMHWEPAIEAVTFAPRAYCKVDVAPPCLEKMSERAARAGSLVTEVFGEKFDDVPSKGTVFYGEFDISSRLPRGYGYRIHSPEGEDDSPYLDLPAGQRIGIGVQ